jgi:hypothetical protein
MVAPHSTTTTTTTSTAILLALSILGSTSATPTRRGVTSRSSGLIPKRARASSLGKRSEGEGVKPIFRLGLAEGKEVQLVHRRQDELQSDVWRRAEILSRAEGGDQVVGSIEDLSTRSG